MKPVIDCVLILMNYSSLPGPWCLPGRPLNPSPGSVPRGFTTFSRRCLGLGGVGEGQSSPETESLTRSRTDTMDSVTRWNNANIN